MNYVPRIITPRIVEASQHFPVIVITGPRQVGKSTLCRHVFPAYRLYNLEDAAFRSSVGSDPKGFLAHCGEHVIIDEVQHVPELLSYIQIIVDERPDRRFVLTGSSNFALLESISQSLAGRAAVFTLMPFSLRELEDYKATATDDMMLGGFYPAVRAGGMPRSLFYSNYYTLYVERDVRQIKEILNLPTFQHFMRLLAGRVANELNASALSNALGVSAPTVKRWLGLLQTSYIAYPLTPFYANLRKRLSKMPKIYFYDTGLLCYLLDIATPQQLATHPLRGPVFENMVVSEMLKDCYNTTGRLNISFYRENAGREVDVVQEDGQALTLSEIKSAATFSKDFTKNLAYLTALLGDKVAATRLIYDGDFIPPNIFNFRQLF